MEALNRLWEEFNNLDKASKITIISIVVTVVGIIVAFLSKKEKRTLYVRVTHEHCFNFPTTTSNTPYPQNDAEIVQLRKKKLLIYVDCINETLNKYLGEGLRIDPRNFHDLAKDAERVEKAFGISMEDANIIAVVNIRQDIRAQARAIPHLKNTLNPEYLDETSMNLLAKMSVKAQKVIEEYWIEIFGFRGTITKR